MTDKAGDRTRQGAQLSALDILQMSDEEYRALLSGSDTPLATAAAGGGATGITMADVDALRLWLLAQIGSDELEVLSALDPTPERKRRLLDYVRRWVARMEHHEGRLAPTPAVVEELYARSCGLGPLEQLLDDAEITEITVQQPERVLVQRRGKQVIAEGVTFAGGREEVLGWIRYLAMLAGQAVGKDHPQVAFALRDGSRVTVTHPPVGLSISLRRKRAEPWTLEDWLNSGSLSEEMVAWLRQVFESGRLGVLFAGGSGTGKTSLLEAVLGFVPVGNVLLIQENAELHTEVHPTLSVFMADPRHPRSPTGLRAIATGAMLQAPKFVIIGEVKGAEVVPAMMAVDAGSGGAATTCHAQSAKEAYGKLRDYCAEDEAYQGKSEAAIFAAVARTFPICIHLRLSVSGQIYVSQILQVAWDDEAKTLRFVETFAGKEEADAGRVEIVYSKGPGWAEPIARVQDELALVGVGGDAGMLRRDARREADNLYRQAVASASVEDFSQAIRLLEQGITLVGEEPKLTDLLAEYRLQIQEQQEIWQHRLERVRRELEAAMAKGEAAVVEVQALLRELDAIGGETGTGDRREIRGRVETWLADRDQSRVAKWDMILESADVPTLLAWGTQLWRAGRDQQAQQFFARVLELDPENFEAATYLEVLSGT